MDPVELCLKAALCLGRVCINAHDLDTFALGLAQIRKGLQERLLYPLSSHAKHGDVLVGADGAFFRNSLCVPTVMTAKCSIGFMKHLERAALIALTFPPTTTAIQHG